MAKLYPPIIEGSIPAFYGTKLLVPFSMNTSVGQSQVKAIALKVKTVQSNTFLFETISNNIAWEASSPYASFDLSKYIEKLNAGQFYKIQIAYIDDDNNYGYFSTVGIIKYTQMPNVIIDNLDKNRINNFGHTYIGLYTPGPNDPTEREYSFRFIFTDENNNIISDSGVLLHNSDIDVSNKQSSDRWEYLTDLADTDGLYYIQYIVNTINGLTVASPKYKILPSSAVQPDVNISLHADLNFDNGYIQVHVKDESNGIVEQPLTGGFVLMRAESDATSDWVEIQRQTLQSVLPSALVFKDFSIEQGKTYIYSVQQYNDEGLHSQRILSNYVYADFEHAFLFDGSRQLKIEYNPKVSSFKTTLLETKIDTIGSKYPFIFRNGVIEYKEFPISGLISYWSDDEELFMLKSEMGLNLGMSHRQSTEADKNSIINTIYSHNAKDAWGAKEIVSHTPTKNLINYNIMAERVFKLEVLDWLNNGQPKLFKSPGEGNYIVRLMNSSLTPNDVVGRMLHTFQSQAYEVDTYNYSKLKIYGLVQSDKIITANLKWHTILLDNNKMFNSGINFNQKNWVDNIKDCTEVVFYDFYPGTALMIKTQESAEWTQIVIGPTGTYHFNTGEIITDIRYLDNVISWEDSVQKVVGPNIPKQQNVDASILIKYTGFVKNYFNLLNGIQIDDLQIRQTHGPGIGLLKDSTNGTYGYYSLFKTLTDYLPKTTMAINDSVSYFKSEIWRLIELKFEKRDIKTLYLDVDSYGVNDSIQTEVSELLRYPCVSSNIINYLYIDNQLQKKIDEVIFNAGCLYQLIPISQLEPISLVIDLEGMDEYDLTEVLMDGNTLEIYPLANYSTKVYLNTGSDEYSFSDWDAKAQELENSDYANVHQTSNNETINPCEDNNQILDLEDIDEIIIHNAFPNKDFFIGVGVTATVAYVPKTNIYNIEIDKTSNSYEAKKQWLELKNTYEENVDLFGYSNDPTIDEVIQAYQNFLNSLDDDLVKEVTRDVDI